MANKKRTPRGKFSFPKIWKKKAVLIPSVIIFVIAVLYAVALFSPIPFISYWRTVWIETAMTSGDHQWLATSFIPKNIIDEVMSNMTDTSDVIGGVRHLSETTVADDTEKTSDVTPETEQKSDTTAEKTDDKSAPDPNDILEQASLKVGDKDYAGNTVVINDIDEGIIVSEIVSGSYRGLVMLIDDPSRVYLGTTNQKDVEGLRIKTMLSYYGAIAGINASGFSDPDDMGTGGEVMGMSYDGEFWGEYVDFYGSVLITGDNNLVVGNVTDWSKYDIRCGIQFGPVLIADGKAQIIGTGGYGIQPRTVIAQRKDGVMLFMVIDGRQIGWSLGCTMEDLTNELLKYDVENAACCDGGSSSVLAYDGEVLNRNSSANPKFGRRLPNAFLVSPKSK